MPQTLYLLVILSGFASLSWEVIWQLKSSLALGVSAWGAAITLAVMMSGMSLGGLLMGQLFHNRPSLRAFHIYALLELIIGTAGFFLESTFYLVEKIDTLLSTGSLANLPLIHIFGIIVALSIPSLCIGATLPVIGVIAKQYEISLAKLYGLNTLGAAAGALAVALIFIPLMGVTQTIWVISAINLFAGGFAWLCNQINWDGSSNAHIASRSTTYPKTDPACNWKEHNQAAIIIFISSFATFTLEVAWFRSLASTFLNSTDVFAIMLASTLIALGLAARRVPTLKQNKKQLGVQIAIAGILILLTTPIIERFDILFSSSQQETITLAADAGWLLSQNMLTVNWLAIMLYVIRLLIIFFMICCVITPSISYLGVAFPWILEDQHSPRRIGMLTAVSSIAAAVGSLGAAWILLPMIGFVKTAWIAGAFVILAGISITSERKRYSLALASLSALAIAIFFQTNIGVTRVQSPFANIPGLPAKVLASLNGPDETVSAIEYSDGSRAILINSASAAGEASNSAKPNPANHYMAWSGHLPMLLQSNPKNVLVVCFGTGQTVNAVRRENPVSIDVVDVNSNVFKLAHFFKSNENVLNDPKVTAITMDGRAYLRRTKKVYDVITLEPMPPTMAGVNALYSREFYLLAREKLTSNGIVTQWLPLHMVAPFYASSIVKTFIDVFPNAVLWLDPISHDGIMLGTKSNVALATTWPGFARTIINRNLSPAVIRNSILLNAEELQSYSQRGTVINDDNQLLAYGKSLYANTNLENENLKLLQRYKIN